MAKNQQRAELPQWVLPAVIAVGIVVLVFIGYRAFTGYNSAPGPPKAVHPGMYNFRAEVQKGNVGYRGPQGAGGR